MSKKEPKELQPGETKVVQNVRVEPGSFTVRKSIQEEIVVAWFKDKWTVSDGATFDSRKEATEHGRKLAEEKGLPISIYRKDGTLR